jgi:hypothetical protein
MQAGGNFLLKSGGELSGDITPRTNQGANLGSLAKRWLWGYFLSLNLTNNGQLLWYGRSKLESSSSGVISILTSAGADLLQLSFGTTSLFITSGTPEGAITAPVGSLAINKTGGAGTAFYVKESGAGNTGWVGK